MTEALIQHRIPNFDSLPLAQVVAAAAALVPSTVGPPASEAQIAAAEHELGFELPTEYREFALSIGSVSLTPDEEDDWGSFFVLSPAELLQVRDGNYRPTFDEWKPANWRVSSVSGLPRFSRDELREQLATQLELTALPEDLPLYDDYLNGARFAYRRMVPVVGSLGDLHHGVLCAGPEAKLFEVHIKDGTVDPAARSFGEMVREGIGNVQILD